MNDHVADVRLLLGPDADSAAAARDAMDAFRDDVSPETLEDLRLLVSELVTNSYRHGGLSHRSRIELRAFLGDEAVHLEVCDPGSGFRAPNVPTPREDGGWGLYLVDHLSDRWGVRRDGNTCVWLEIDL